MSFDTIYTNPIAKKALIAVSVSLAFHLVLAMVVETSMSQKRGSPPTLIDISRRPSEGSNALKEAEKILDPSNPESPFSGVDAGVPVRRRSAPPRANDPGEQGATSSNSSTRPTLPPFSNVGIPIPRNPRQTDTPRNDSTPNRQQDPNEPAGRDGRPGTDANNLQPERGTRQDGGTGQNQPGQDSQNPGGSVASRRARGPNRGAAPLSTVEPKIPPGLLGPGVTNSVGVKVLIRADGTFVVSIERSSGSSQVDDIVLAAMRQWKWDPAAEENVPVDSTQIFKYIFKT